MRTLTITQNVTVDGSIELLGRRTFLELRSFWPEHSTDPTGVAGELDRVAKYVVSSTLTEPGWANSVVLGSNWLEQVVALRQEDGGDIVVTGSISLCAALVAAGVVDEYRLFVHPVVQGRGRRLFPDDGHARPLVLRDSRRFPSGVVLSTYAGAQSPEQS